VSVFFPSMVVNLKLAFDDTLTIAVPGLPAWEPNSVQGFVQGAAAVTKPTSQPLVLAGGPASYVLNRVPAAATVEMPGHRPAARFNLTFPYKDLPIDPRTIKSCAVDIYLGAVTRDGFAAGMHGQLLGGKKPSVLDPTGFFGGSSNPNRLMTGLVDEWSVNHDEDGSTVSMGGRDMRGILIDTPISTDPTLSTKILNELDLSQSVTLVIRDLLKCQPMMAGIKVRTSLAEWPGGKPPSPGLDALGRNRKGAKGKKAGGRASAAGGEDKVTFWDVIVKLCFLAGAIPAFVGTELRIRPVRSLYDQQRAGFDPFLPTPFEGGLPRTIDAESGSTIAPISVRKMVYGRDVGSMSFARKFGGYQKPRQVCCVGINTSAADRGAARMIKGLYPTEAIASRAYADGVKSMADTLFVKVGEVSDVERLSLMAQSIYEEMARGEITGSCTTTKLASFGGDNADPDLLKLRPGDAVQFATDVRALTKVSPLVSTHTDHMRAPFEKAVADLSAQLGQPDLARVILATSRGLINEVQGFFRVSAVHYTWGSDGLKIDFDFQNFIEKTFDKDKSISKTGGPTLDLLVPSQEGV
jgi:hypothetical protein